MVERAKKLKGDCDLKNEINEIIKEALLIEGETEETVLENIEEKVRNFVGRLSNGIDECESPIEKMMMVEFNQSEYGNALYNQLEKMFDIFMIQPQAKLKIKNKEEIKEYRVDFLVLAHNQNGYNFNFVVECDGFEHHSSKEKFQNDRKRDRELLHEGYITIRLYGSEIVKDSSGCLYEVYRTILSFIENRHRI